MTDQSVSMSDAIDVTDSVDVAVGTELWYTWGCIAVEQAGLARAARTEWTRRRDAGESWEMDDELKPAMLAISAVATSLDGFERRVSRTGLTVPPPSGPDPKRHEWIWATLRAGFDVDSRANDWRRAIKDVFALRNSTAGGLLHPTTVFTIPNEHPAGGMSGGVSLARSVFTTENADKAVSVMRDIYGTCRASVRPNHPELEDLIRRVLAGVLKKLSVSDASYAAWGSGGPDDLSNEA